MHQQKINVIILLLVNKLRRFGGGAGSNSILFIICKAKIELLYIIYIIGPNKMGKGDGCILSSGSKWILNYPNNQLANILYPVIYQSPNCQLKFIIYT